MFVVVFVAMLFVVVVGSGGGSMCGKGIEKEKKKRELSHSVGKITCGRVTVTL